jgi:chemotaxis protein methyltransferase CheR
MTAVPTSPVSRFAALVERHLGLVPDDGRWRELETVLEERAGGDVAGYLGRLAAAPEPDELRALAERLTVGETYFLRHPAQLDALVDNVLPSLLRQASTVRVLSAGSSTGEEAYSVALLARERGRVDVSRLRLLGIDVNPRALELARRACYSPWSLRSMSPAMRQRWFQRTPEGFALSPQVRDRVVFEERNLMLEAPAFWAAGSFHVILCRNVLLYFAPEMVRQIIARMAQALVPGGYLFLGPSETLRGISEEFDLKREGDAFYYQLKAPAPPAPRPTPPAGLQPERAATPPPVPPPPDGVAEVLRLVEQERHEEAWARLEALPESARSEAGLLRAVLHLHAGRLREAERLGRELATSGPERAAAYYLLGVCGEQAGDEAAARARYTEALRVEPTFALAQLRIGTLARRSGDLAGARVALRMALSLLSREKALYLSLLGGGFGRHGL